MLLVVKQRQKRMRTLIKKQALDTRTRFHGAGDRGRTGTVSLPSDFESDTSANSITPAHNAVYYTVMLQENQVLLNNL